ncbi:MAG: translation initiation factor IF-2 [Aequorivita sp.]|nr:translation initiation factor IF-2 [Aequorivita sp.]
MTMKTYFNIIITSVLILAISQKSSAQNATLTVNADSNITQLLALKKDLEKENKLSDGYTIQLYYGELDKANRILNNYRSKFGDWPASIEYETPNYKVWAGNFSSRLEAERALIAIKNNFSSAFILKPERRK